MSCIQRMDERADAVFTALQADAALSQRVLKRSLRRHITDHETADLKKGVVMLVCKGEGGYAAGTPNYIAMDGAQDFFIVGHLIDDDDQGPEVIEQMEMDLAEEIKAFMRTIVNGMTFNLLRIAISAQADYPYGMVLAEFQALPPDDNI